MHMQYRIICRYNLKDKKKISGIETQIPLYNQYVNS